MVQQKMYRRSFTGAVSRSGKRVLLMTCVLSAFMCACTTASPVAAYGQIRVEGNRIVDQNGKGVQLRGMSMFWSQWMGKFWNAQVVGWLASDWNATVVRASMAVEHGGYLENPDVEKQKVKTVVDAAIANGIYVIIDWHDHLASSHTDQARTFFEEMARTYGNHPNVIYEIYNEPEQETWSSVKAYAQTIIGAIRAIDPDNLIIVGTPAWSQDVDIAAQSPLTESNIAYALHFYAASHKQELRNKAEAALQAGIALFVTEWGTCEYTGNGYLDEAETRTWLSFMDRHGLSWCNWSIADKAETAAALVGGASTSGGWSESQLTPSGKLLRTTLRDYADDITATHRIEKPQRQPFVSSPTNSVAAFGGFEELMLDGRRSATHVRPCSAIRLRSNGRSAKAISTLRSLSH